MKMSRKIRKLHEAQVSFAQMSDKAASNSSTSGEMMEERMSETQQPTKSWKTWAASGAFLNGLWLG